MKKQKHFYSHIIETSSLSLVLGDMDITKEERTHLLSLAESNLHHEIIDVVLSELSSDDKKLFLQHLADDDHNKIWQLLNNRVNTIEEKIKTTAEDVIKELHKDVKEVT